MEFRGWFFFVLVGCTVVLVGEGQATCALCRERRWRKRGREGGRGGGHRGHPHRVCRCRLGFEQSIVSSVTRRRQRPPRLFLSFNCSTVTPVPPPPPLPPKSRLCPRRREFTQFLEEDDAPSFHPRLFFRIKAHFTPVASQLTLSLGYCNLVKEFVVRGRAKLEEDGPL